MSRSFSLFSPRGSSAIWNGLASGADPAALAFPTQSDRLPAPQPGPRATSAYAVPDFPYGPTASCLNSAVCLGDGLPMARFAFPVAAIVPKRKSSCQRIWDRFNAMARAVICGDYDNGDERKRRLGSYYSIVQTRVNEMLS